MSSLPEFAANEISGSGRTSEKLNLISLQSKMKVDPEGYSSELSLVYNQFKSSLELFQQQAALNFTSLSGNSTDPTVAKDLSDRVMFLSHVTPFYPNELAQFPSELVQFLESSARNLPSGLRFNATQSLILLINRKIIDLSETLVVFMELQTLGDRALRQLAFTHVIQSIKRMNQKHKNDPKNRALQNILFRMLQQEEEAKAKRALITLCDLHRRKIWVDERTSNAICTACFHASPGIMIAALSFLLGCEKIEGDGSDDSDNDDDQTPQPQVILNKEAVYKASHKGTTSSKKKKKAKLERVARSMKKQQRLSSEKSNITSYYSPLNHLKDPQGFAEKLFARLHSSNQSFEKKMMMLKVIARTISLHHLILLNFYQYIQRYVQPHQTDVTTILAAAVQACHDMVPPDAVEPLFKQIVNQFVHDKSRPEAITVGLNAVREICLRMPLLMTEDLLQDLVLYRKSNEKSVSAAARSLLSLFREVCPSLLIKKDRGRPGEPKAKPKAFGEVRVDSNIPGVELLEQENEGSSDEDMDGSVDLVEEDGSGESDGDFDCESGGSMGAGHEVDDDSDGSAEDDDVSEDDDNYSSDGMEITDEEESREDADDENGEATCLPDIRNSKGKKRKFSDFEVPETDNSSGKNSEGKKRKFSDFEVPETDNSSGKNSEGKKRKFSDFEGQLNAGNNSLRTLKKLAVETQNASSNTNDGILSNEDFQRIRELKAKKDARATLAHHGFKLPSSDQLSTKRVDATTLEANIKVKLTKEEKLALIREGREESGKYRSRTSIKKKKTGGTSNRQKEHKKIMPDCAKKARISRNRQEKKLKKRGASKQFRGRKAWK